MPRIGFFIHNNDSVLRQNIVNGAAARRRRDEHLHHAQGLAVHRRGGLSIAGLFRTATAGGRLAEVAQLRLLFQC